MIGGVTRRMLAHLSGVPHLNVNRPQTRHFYEKTLFNFSTVTVTSSSERNLTITHHGPGLKLHPVFSSDTIMECVTFTDSFSMRLS